MKKLTIEADIACMDTVLDWLNEELEANDVSMRAVMQLDVAVEEIFVNIAHYAYAPGKGLADITMDISDDRMISVRFEDSGVPYNPLAQDDPDVSLSADDRPIGGLGIFMVKKTMDNVTYAHENGKNVLTIYKKG